MKRFLVTMMSVSVISACSFGMMGTAFADESIQVNINGSRLQMDEQPINDNGTTLVQFRPVFEKLGLKIDWNGDTRTITGSKEGLTIQLQIDSRTAYVNEQTKTLEKAPRIVNNNTMIPLRFVSEATGNTVNWNGETNTVDISAGQSSVVKQYGNESYDPDNSSGGMMTKETETFEKDGYLYVVWSRQDPVKNNIQYKVSIAKDGKWFVKGKTVTEAPNGNSRGFSNARLLLDNNIFFIDDKGLKRVTFNEQGDSVSNDYVVQLSDQKSYGYLYLHQIFSGDKKGIIFGADGGLNIYFLDDLAHPLPVKDLHKQATYFATPLNYPTVVLDKSQTYISFLEYRTFLKRININTGDLVYDDNGKDKTYPLFGPDQQGKTLVNLTYDDGNYYLLYKSQDGSIGIMKMDEDLNIVSDTPNIGYRSPEVVSSVTFVDNEIHIWEKVEFQRKPALQLTTISRP